MSRRLRVRFIGTGDVILVAALLVGCGHSHGPYAERARTHYGRPSESTLHTFGVPLPAAADDVTYAELTGWSGRDLYLRFSLRKAEVPAFLARFDAKRLQLLPGCVPFVDDDEREVGWKAIRPTRGLRGGSASALTETSPAIDLCFVPTGPRETVYVSSGLA